MSNFFVIDINDRVKKSILQVDRVRYFSESDAARFRSLADGFGSRVQNPMYNRNLIRDDLNKVRSKSSIMSNIAKNTESFYRNKNQ